MQSARSGDSREPPPPRGHERALWSLRRGSGRGCPGAGGASRAAPAAIVPFPAFPHPEANPAGKQQRVKLKSSLQLLCCSMLRSVQNRRID